MHGPARTACDTGYAGPAGRIAWRRGGDVPRRSAPDRRRSSGGTAWNNSNLKANAGRDRSSRAGGSVALGQQQQGQGRHIPRGLCANLLGGEDVLHVLHGQPLHPATIRSCRQVRTLPTRAGEGGRGPLHPVRRSGVDARGMRRRSRRAVSASLPRLQRPGHRAAGGRCRRPGDHPAGDVTLRII